MRADGDWCPPLCEGMAIANIGTFLVSIADLSVDTIAYPQTVGAKVPLSQSRHFG